MNPVGLETSKPNTNDIHGKLWLAKHHFIKNHFGCPEAKKISYPPWNKQFAPQMDWLEDECVL